jgi:hypothetical protein
MTAAQGMDKSKWVDVFASFKSEPQQLEGIGLLFDVIQKADASILSKVSPWFHKYTTKPPEPAASKVLKVPYQSQLDNASGTGYRECFSSTCAMIARYWGKVVNDDAYNKIRASYGDSTSAEAQLAALRHLGLKADFRTDGDPNVLIQEILNGQPVAVGWLHRGSVQAPSGGGHWTCLIGFTPSAWIMNDPNGEALLVAGGYTNNRNGAGIAYSKKNWGPRWMVGGTGGWYLKARP